jgi:hypothetical protein
MGISGILFLLLLVTPLVFQILFGSGLIAGSKKMKFWHICVISVVLLLITFFIDSKIISYILVKKGIRDGMPFTGLIILEAIVATAMALTIFIQILVKYFRNRKEDQC